jgi:hypothetical protein
LARISRIILAQKEIDQYFNASGKSVYSNKEMQGLIEAKRTDWKLPATTSAHRIAEKWVANKFIRAHTFKINDGTEYPCYLFGEPSIYEIAVSLRSKSYISHYPAVFMHELTTQVPKTIYTTQELSAKRNRNTSLSQAAIDKAFSQPQRRAHLSTEYEDYTIILLSGMHTGRSGVLLSTRYKNAFSYTSLERTLIDITVRPNYAGGSFAVLDAYRRAVQQDLISSNKLLAVFENIDFIYPYHQAIGFYLEKAGYKGRALEEFRNRSMSYQFYLDYEIREKLYDETWKIWYPKGM